MAFEPEPDKERLILLCKCLAEHFDLATDDFRYPNRTICLEFFHIIIQNLISITETLESNGIALIRVAEAFFLHTNPKSELNFFDILTQCVKSLPKNHAVKCQLNDIILGTFSRIIQSKKNWVYEQLLHFLASNDSWKKIEEAKLKISFAKLLDFEMLLKKLNEMSKISVESADTFLCIFSSFVVDEDVIPEIPVS